MGARHPITASRMPDAPQTWRRNAAGSASRMKWQVGPQGSAALAARAGHIPVSCAQQRGLGGLHDCTSELGPLSWGKLASLPAPSKGVRGLWLTPHLTSKPPDESGGHFAPHANWVQTILLSLPNLNF